jgi:hypothetical protein
MGLFSNVGFGAIKYRGKGLMGCAYIEGVSGLYFLSFLSFGLSVQNGPVLIFSFMPQNILNG